MQDAEAVNMSRTVRSVLLPLLTMLGVVLLWELCCVVFKVPEFVLPAPSAIVVAARKISAHQWMLEAFATLRVALMGYVAAIAISLPLAVLLTRSEVLSQCVYPILVVIHSAPIVAIAPIIVVSLGVSDLPRVVITCIIAFFPIIISTTTGLLSTPDELIELSRSLRAPKHREILQIRLPYAIPHIFSALKISITLAVVGAVVAEFVAAEQGLGYYILLSTSTFKLPQAFAGLVILVTLSLALFQAVVFAQKRFFPWSVPVEKSNA